MRNKLQLSLLALLFIALQQNLSAQGGVGINVTGAAPDSSAILDISSVNKGILIPRMSSSQRSGISNPGTSLMVFDTTNNCLEIYGYGVWHTVTCLCTTPPSSPGSINGNTNPCSGATSVVYSVSQVSGANSYTWTVPGDATILAGQGTNSVLVNIGNNPGNITVTANNDCGTSGISTLPITINTIPQTPGMINGSSTVINISTGNIYSISPVNNATIYTWTVLPDASITSGQGTDSIVVTFGTSSGNIYVTAGNSCGTSSASGLAVCNYNHGSQTFNYSGFPQTYTVPACVSTITITANGAQGGYTGGLGGYAKGDLAVTPGQVLNVYVGGSPSSSTGGFNGGGNGSSYGGGGASDVRTGSDLSTRVIVAGGGGASTPWGSVGGDGGGTTGGDATNSNAYYGCGNGIWGTGGTGGTQNAGGAAGSYAGYTSYGGWSGQAGSLGTGGGPDGENGGGGGGGYYGGGSGGSPGCSGWGAGGGGGSSYITGLANAITTSGTNSGNGSVTITW